jgi:hypothetical protein
MKKAISVLVPALVLLWLAGCITVHAIYLTPQPEITKEVLIGESSIVVTETVKNTDWSYITFCDNCDNIGSRPPATNTSVTRYTYVAVGSKIVLIKTEQLRKEKYTDIEAVTKERDVWDEVKEDKAIPNVTGLKGGYMEGTIINGYCK